MDDFDRFYNSSLRFLSYRPRSEKEVRDKLVSKKASLEIADKVISKLKKYNFVNDAEFAKKWIEDRSKFKPRSFRLIKLELKRKGIDDETIDNLHLTISSDLEQAKKLVEKRIIRFRNKFGMTREEIYQKLGRFLASKGFSWDTIKKSIDETLDKVV